MPEPATERIPRRDRVVLGAVTLGVLSLQLTLACSWHTNHDESWHVYFAAHDFGVDLFRDLLRDTHPPLSYLLARPLTALGTDPVWPRLTSILPSLVQVWLMFSILRRLGVHPVLSHGVTIAMVVSHHFTVLGVILRSYSLATMFTLAALDQTLRAMQCAGSGRAGTLSLLFATLAVWSVYPAGLTIAAFGASTWLCCRFVTAREATRRWSSTLSARHWIAFLASLIACVVYLLLTWGPRTLTHVAWFPSEDQGPYGFALRGANQILADFTPLPVNAESGPSLAMLTVVTWLTIAWRSRRGPHPERTIVLCTAPTLAVALAILGWVHWYPFGGEARHMYVLYPMMILGLGIILEEVRVLLRQRWAALALAATTVAIAAWSSVARFDRGDNPEIARSPAWHAEAAILFDTGEKPPPPIYITTSAFGAWYSEHRKLGWHYQGRPLPNLFEFRLANRWRVFRDELSWSVTHAFDARLFEQLNLIATHTGEDRVVVFGPSYDPVDRRQVPLDELERVARHHGYTVERISQPAKDRVYWLRRIDR